MLHDIINEQEKFLDIRDGISEKNIIFRMFSYKSLASCLNLRNYCHC